MVFKIFSLASIVVGIFVSFGKSIYEYIFKKERSFGPSPETITKSFLSLAFLTAINLYAKIGKIAGAGSIVPITGFSNSIVSPAIEFKTEGYILGLGANMFKVAGPVLVYGITTSVIVGFVYWIIKLFM